MIEDLIATNESYKAFMEYKNLDFDADKHAQYIWVREAMAKLYKEIDDSLFGPVNLPTLQQNTNQLTKEEQIVIIGNLNINSLPNKFDQLREIVLKYVDVLVVTDTKLDDTFLTSQFLVTGFSVPYRLDRNRNGGGIMIFIRDDIPSRVLTKHVFADDIEGLLRMIM